MYLNLRATGKLFGVSSHVAGRWAWEIGLRTDGGRPSQEAFDGGFVSRAPLPNGGYYWVWDAEKIIKAFQAAGHVLVAQEASVKPAPKAAPRINGPFSMVESAPDAFQIISGNGKVSIWVTGRNNADFVTKMLNLCYDRGMLRKV
jgi:hypothetical protein